MLGTLARAACANQGGASMTIQLISQPEHLSLLADGLRGEPRLAVDLEAAGFHRYSDRVCLIQISTPDRTFLVDPLALDPSDALRAPLEDTEVRILVHGGDYDLRLLDRDLDLHPTNLFDTQSAAALLGEPSLGLAALLETHFGVRLSKKFQRADWAQRPLSEDMLAYAASDTQHLHALTDLLSERLEAVGRLEWAEEESALLESLRWSDAGEVDPVTKVKGARDLEPRDVALAREAWHWRDEIARKRDRAPFRVAGDPVLLEVVRERPRNARALAQVRGFSDRLAESSGRDLLARLEKVDALTDEDLVGYPRVNRSGPGRPPPELEAIVDRLKAVRNRLSEELGIARGSLVSNTLLIDIARIAPATTQDLAAISGVRRWQVEAVGGALLGAL